jgi:hypothetical protein
MNASQFGTDSPTFPRQAIAQSSPMMICLLIAFACLAIAATEAKDLGGQTVSRGKIKPTLNTGVVNSIGVCEAKAI